MDSKLKQAADRLIAKINQNQQRSLFRIADPTYGTHVEVTQKGKTTRFLMPTNFSNLNRN